MVDEDAGYRRKVRSTLEKQYRVLEASDAESAAAIIAGQDDRISAVILSMTLPENGAASLLKDMRQNPMFWRIPVLATIPGGRKINVTPLAICLFE